jgi:hypothetical protein
MTGWLDGWMTNKYEIANVPLNEEAYTDVV